MSEREQAIERLQALELRSGGSHEMLSSIAKAIYEPTYGGWTIGACQVLRDTLIKLLGETDAAAQGESITGELRSFTKDPLLGYASQSQHIERLTAIADRIDAAHEEAIQREHEKAYDTGYVEGMGMANAKDAQAEYLRGKNDGYDEGWDAGFASADDWLGQHEDAMAEHGWVRLPKDADGEYIHLGDVMEWCDSGDTLEVVGIGADDTLFYFDKDSDGEEMADWTSARNKRHHHKQPTVEDVLREFLGEMQANESDPHRTITEYAAKLQLAGDAE